MFGWLAVWLIANRLARDISALFVSILTLTERLVPAAKPQGKNQPMRKNMKNLTASVLVALAAIFALASPVKAGFIDINGGTSWTGWEYRGKSTDLGIWARGSTTNVYEIYTTQFAFNNNVVTGSPSGSVGFSPGPLSPGAFQNGNRILGVGIRRISGANSVGGTSGAGIVRFDLGNDSYSAASSVGGTDGRASSTSFASKGDFNTQFYGTGSSPTSFLVFAGPGDFRSAGNGGDHAFRSFSKNLGTANASYQMFFDLTAIPSVYSGGVFTGNYTVGTIGDDITLSIRGFGDTDAVLSVSSVPEPSSLLLVGSVMGMGVLRRRRS